MDQHPKDQQGPEHPPYDTTCTRPEDQRHALVMLVVGTETDDLSITGVMGRVAELPDQSLPFLQYMAGSSHHGGSGYVDVISDDCTDTPIGIPLDMWVDDEGKLNDSPLNMIASLITGQEVYGDVVICTRDDEGETIGLSEEHIDMLTGAITGMMDDAQSALEATGSATAMLALSESTPFDTEELADMLAEKVTEHMRRGMVDQMFEDPEVRQGLEHAIDQAEQWANGGLS